MIYLLLYLLSILLAPVLGGLLDRKYNTGYPAGNLIFILASPLMCVIIVIAFICCFIGSLDLDYDNINPIKRLYDRVKGDK